MMRLSLWPLIMVGMLAIAGCASLEPKDAPSAVPEIAPGILQGYLQQRPNSLRLVPPPPAEGSGALARDLEISRNSLSLRGSPRWKQAARDAVLMFPAATAAFNRVLGFEVTETETPHLYRLMRRTLADAGLSTYGAKNHYHRARPFMRNGAPICTPRDREVLRQDGSYPSGHSAIGWAWALILSELVPKRGDALIARGREFGQSRVVCNVHWQSDVDEGRFMGAATVARLHADPDFQSDLEGARREIAAARDRD